MLTDELQFLHLKRNKHLERCERLAEKIAEFEEEYDDAADVEVRRTLKRKVEKEKEVLREAEAELYGVITQLREIEQDVEIQNKIHSGGLLHHALLRLNYHAQEEVFQKLIYRSSIGAFIIHGESGHGQRWLLNRLIRRVPRIAVAKPPIRINLQLTGYGWDINGLQQQFSHRDDLRHTCSLQEVIDQIHSWWQTQTVVLIFDNLNAMNADYMKEFIRNFWQPLVDKATQAPSSNYSLVVFLIDNLGHVDTWPFDIAEALDQSWNPYKLVKLPKLVPILDEELSGWLEDSGHKLPMKIRVEEVLRYNKVGIPQTVFIDICDLCGCDWYEKESQWILY